MIAVNRITKAYGQQLAVNDLTFTASPGEILGFLGPNGAGKSTTMKMITGYLSPTSGEVTVCNQKVSFEDISTRKKIGYLPENNPLYKDMYIKEFLTFCANIHQLEHKAKRIDEVIELTGLGVEKNKLIGSLSKGYRQRVGLAQAILHDPEVLILDEPTSGLDMNQLVDIRALIKEMGKNKTVIFSTHIMQEVQALCDRVVIINNGKLVADDPIDNLQSRIKGENILKIDFKEEYNLEVFKTIPGVKSIKVNGRSCEIITDYNKDMRSEIFNLCANNQFVILEMKLEELNVEDIFRKLTKTSTDV